MEKMEINLSIMTKDQLKKFIVELEKENKKLKECNKSQSEVINNVFIPQKEELKEEIKKLKEENEKLKYNNKLYKERIDEIQIAYMKFEKATDEKYKAFRKAY